eukprot:SAG31_NODE_927_length_10930_cov_15.134983_6_plen_52_part_00
MRFSTMRRAGRPPASPGPGMMTPYLLEHTAVLRSTKFLKFNKVSTFYAYFI